MNASFGRNGKYKLALCFRIFHDPGFWHMQTRNAARKQLYDFLSSFYCSHPLRHLNPNMRLMLNYYLTEAQHCNPGHGMPERIDYLSVLSFRTQINF